MKIEAWKCEQTGQLFETEAAYLQHEQTQREQQARTAQLAELHARLKFLQQLPFINASSVDEMLAGIEAHYNGAVDLLVELGELPAGRIGHRLVEVRAAGELGLGRIDSARAHALGLRSEAIGITGHVTFVYEGALGGSRNEAFLAFPALGGEFVAEGWAMAAALDLPKPAQRAERIFQTCYVSVLLESVPMLQRQYNEFMDLEKTAQPELEERIQGIVGSRVAADARHMAACERMRELEHQAHLLQQERAAQIALTDEVTQSVHAAVLAEEPVYARYQELRNALGVDVREPGCLTRNIAV